MTPYSKKGIISLCSLVYFTSYFARKDFAAVSVGMIEDSAVGIATAGLIGSAMFAMYGVGQIISGILGDKVSPKLLISIGLITTAICNIAMPFLPNQALFVPVWGLNGLAQAMLWPPIVRILAQHLDNETYVKANLLITSAAHVATILLYLYAPICLLVFSWKGVFVSAGVLSAAVFAIFIICISLVIPNDEKIKSERVEKNGQKTSSIAPATENFVKAMMRAGLIPIFFAIVAMGFLRDGIESWLPTLYASAFNRDPAESIIISVMLPIFSIISVTVVTVLHKKAFKNETFGVAITFILAAVLCIPLYFLMGSAHPVGRIVCLILAALVCACMHAGNFLYISCLPGRFAKIGHAAGTSGICNACVYVGAAISTSVIAFVAEKFSWSATVVVWGIIALAGFVFAFISYRPYTAFLKNE